MPPFPDYETRGPGNEDDDIERAPEMAPMGRTVCVTATTGPVRGLFRPRPWIRALRLGTHGRIADGGGPQTRLERRMRWSAEGDSGGASGL